MGNERTSRRDGFPLTHTPTCPHTHTHGAWIVHGSENHAYPSAILGYGHHADGVRAFRWAEQGGLQNLGVLPNGFVSRAANVSADEDGADEAFVWDARNGMRSIRDLLLAAQMDVEDWQLDLAMGISADGSGVVGVGVNSDEHPESWRAVLP